MELNNFVRVLGGWSRGEGPLYRRLANSIMEASANGDLSAGTALPAERVLAGALAISRSTVVGAYELLRQQGWAESRQGSRTRLTPQPVHKLLEVRDSSNRAPSGSLLRTVLEDTRPVIDFSVGAPGNLPAFSTDAFIISRDVTTHLLAERGYSAFGMPALRRAVADYYSNAGLPTTENQILITNGAQQAISLIATCYLQRGDPVIVENPTYFGAIDVFRSAGARLIASRVEPDGINPYLVRTQVETSLPRLIYLQPSFQNPTGTILSESRRRQLIQIAAEFNVPLVEDNTLGDLSLERTPLPLLAGYVSNTEAVVLTIGSMSKLFWAGLRIGWIRAPEPVLTRLARLRVLNDLGSSFITQLIASRLIGDTERIITARREELLPKLALLTGLLSTHLPEWSWSRPAGGLFLWVKLPAGNATAFAQLATRFGVALVPGNTMSVDETHNAYLRLPFLLDNRSLSEGVKRLVLAWEAYQPLLQNSPVPPQILV